MYIVPGDFADPRIIAMIRFHFERARSNTAQGCAHVLDLRGLQQPDIALWSCWEADELLGVGALKTLSADHGEIKSMHTAMARRRTGAGSAMLLHLLAEARRNGMSRVSLETGSWDYFIPARALYAKHGFAECDPFGDYEADINSIFMTRRL